MTLLIKTIKELKEKVKEYKKEGLTIGLVPTMGALHRGHFSLIEKAVSQNNRTIVSVFVNPTQFGPNEDYDKYPRTLKEDLQGAEKIGADIVFSPSPDEMYAGCTLNNNYLTYVAPPYEYINKLCGKSRPNHFDGVATVVTKLFNLSEADNAYFGMKDAQQLLIIRKMVKDLNMNINIVPCPIVREDSGLAMSSRNNYLSQNGRKTALALSKTIFTVENLVKNGNIKDVRYLTDVALKLLEDTEVEYIEFVDYDNLENVSTIKNNTLFAIAARVEGVRLIDNILLEE
ncbi:pantoate--beta-alanine ligase [bacterium]|nr:pantoate--beta-alanine ligase [bacterium]